MAVETVSSKYQPSDFIAQVIRSMMGVIVYSEYVLVTYMSATQKAITLSVTKAEFSASHDNKRYKFIHRLLASLRLKVRFPLKL